MSLKNKWNYAPILSQVGDNAAGMGAAVAYGLGLAQIFNPLALGAAAAYGAGRLVYNEYKRRYAGVPDLLRREYLSPLPAEYAYVQKMADDAAQVMNIPRQAVYIANFKMVRAMTPWHYRWLLWDRDTRNRAMRRTAASVSNLDMIMISKEMIQAAPDGELRFIVAHEMSHAKNNDSASLATNVKTMKKYTGHALWAGIGMTMAAAIIGSGGTVAPLLLGPGAWPVLGTMLAAGGLVLTNTATSLFLNAASRVIERRADRNAMYITRDLEGAREGVYGLEDRIDPLRQPAIVEMFGTHPSYHPRMKNLRMAWAEAQAYAAPPTAVEIRAESPVQERPRTAQPTSAWELPPHLRPRHDQPRKDLG